MNKKFGFTLAEVLITLAIIGVVATLTLPMLISNYQEKEMITKLKKYYAIFNQAIQMANVDSGSADNWGGKDFEKDANTVKVYNIDSFVQQLDIANDCGYQPIGCFTSDYKKLSGYNERDIENNTRYRKLQMRDGSIVAIEGYEQPGGNWIAEIWVDLNGNKKPNTVGKDTFLFLITPNTVTPYPADCTENYGSGYGCSKLVLEKENFDYLK